MRELIDELKEKVDILLERLALIEKESKEKDELINEVLERLDKIENTIKNIVQKIEALR